MIESYVRNLLNTLGLGFKGGRQSKQSLIHESYGFEN